MRSPQKISVVGLGYVGLPLAVALARHYDVVGFDVKQSRIEALRSANDITGEVASEELAATNMVFATDTAAMRGSDVFIITVPTPVTADNKPNLGPVSSACKTIGQVMERSSTVVLESTVYPGVTQEICAKILETSSGLKYPADFALGYSPERMNPGDKAHTLARLTKVVSGDTRETAEMLAAMYGKVTNGNVFVARDIPTAEAAKVIENAQRDINIAFINEVTMIFNKLGLSIYDVLDAARTKWNFLPFTPGLVGGHCIGVDPYYLAYKASEIGLAPDVILAGRKINDSMGPYVANVIDRHCERHSRILILGLAFKENVPDLRNSKVVDIVQSLRRAGHVVDVHDPIVDQEEAQLEYDIELAPHIGSLSGYAAVVGAVGHRAYLQLGKTDFSRLLAPNGLLFDIKGIWREMELSPEFRRMIL